MPKQKQSKFNKNNLTTTEAKFVKEYVKNGGHGTEAYMKARNGEITANGASTMSARKLKKPNVKLSIMEELDKQGLNETFISEVLRKQILAGIGIDANATSVNKSLEMLIKMRGGYEEVGKRLIQNNQYNFFSDNEIKSPELGIKKRNKLANYFGGLNKTFNINEPIVEGEEVNQ